MSIAIEGSDHPQIVHVQLWQAGRLEGEVRLPGKVAPDRIGLRAVLVSPPATPAASSFPRSTVACSVDATSHFTCDAPAGTLDLSLQSAGYVPDYRWGVEVPKGRAAPIGLVSLKSGASIAGWVRPGAGTLMPGQGVARLIHLVAPGSNSRLAERLQRPAAEGRIRNDGFFQLAGIAPGTYLLEVTHPGFAPARVYPLEIWQGAETFLREAITLDRPFALRLTLAPPSDWLGKPWQIRLFSASSASGAFDKDPVFSGAASEAGEVRVEGQAPGGFWVTVADSLGNPLFSDPDWWVESAAQAEREIRIDVVTVAGHLTLGERPVSGRLWFGGVHGAERVEMSSDAEGSFHGILPKQGPWQVEIEAKEPRVASHAKVDVQADRKGKASVDITLPDTQVFGKVLFEDGKPAPRADLLVTSTLDSLNDVTETDGSFELRGIPVGSVELAASLTRQDELWTSERLLVPVVDQRGEGPIELHLHRAKEVKGSVVSSRGAVVGATVQLLTKRPNLVFGSSARTGPDGAFSMQVPAGARVVTLVVSPPGLALTSFEVDLTGEPLSLGVAEPAGTLELGIPFTDDVMARRSLTTAVFQNGTALSASTLYHWAHGHGRVASAPGTATFPMMAPGRYEVCVGPWEILADEVELSSWEESKAQCATGYLEAGATLRLSIQDKAGSRP